MRIYKPRLKPRITKLLPIIFHKFFLFLSFVLSLTLEFLHTRVLQKNDIVAGLQLASSFYFGVSLTSRIITKVKKGKHPLLLLVFVSMLVLSFVVWPDTPEELPVTTELIQDLIALTMVVSFFTAASILFEFILWLLKEILLSSFIVKHKKALAVVLFSIFLTLFGYRYYSLERRVNKLENLVGRKRIICDEKASIEKVRKSVVRIIGIDAEGSGFFVESTGLIATNFHVIQYDPNPKIILPDYSFAQGEVVLADKTADLAFIEVSGKKEFSVQEFANSDQIEPMEEIISIGYPFGTDLKGEATIMKGHFVARRDDKYSDAELIQIDMTLNPGSSGGPMINACGEVVGINVVGTAGLGMGISSNYFQDKWLEMAGEPEPLKDVRKLTFNPNGSPKECVEAFYNYQTVGKLKEAYNLLAPEYADRDPFEEWKEGYKNTLNVILHETREEGENQVFVKFSSADLMGEDIVLRYFEGILEVKEVDGNLKLARAEINEIKQPGWDWFPIPDWLK